MLSDNSYIDTVAPQNEFLNGLSLMKTGRTFSYKLGTGKVSRHCECEHER